MAARVTTKRAPRKKSTAKSDPEVSYDDFKEFEGRKYTGMKIGRSHKWYYDQGEWKEKKITPDLWQVSYAVTKRRAGHAPEGSGVPVGTEYHWYILAHQNVRKLNADDYTTSLTGLKFKVAHKRADSEKWSATPKTQRKRMVKFLQDMIEQLEQQQEETDPSKATAEATAPASRSKVKSAKAKTKSASKTAASTTSVSSAKSAGRAVAKTRRPGAKKKAPHAPRKRPAKSAARRKTVKAR